MADDLDKIREKNEEIHALQEKSRGMIRLMTSVKPSRRLQVVDRAASLSTLARGGQHEADHNISAPEETQLQVKLLKAELQDQMELHRSELSSCKQSAQELFVHRTRSEACISKLAEQAAMESQLAEKNFAARLESEQRMWMEERRRMRSAHHRSLQNEKESMEQVRRQASEELASTNRRLEIEARQVREARSGQRAAEGKLKRSEQKQENQNSLLRGEAVEAEAQAKRRQEAVLLEATRLEASLLEAEHEVQRQQTLARIQNEMASKEQDSLNLELNAAVEEVKLGHLHEEELVKVLHSEEAYAAEVNRDLRKTSSELKELSNAFQAAAAEQLHESHVAKEQATVAEKATLIASELRQKLERSCLEVHHLELRHQQDMEETLAELRSVRHEASEQYQTLHHQEASMNETRLQLNATETNLRSVEGSCAEAQLCFDSCYKELISAQEEANEQKDHREQDLLQLHRACEASLEGLPLVFYEEVCKSFEEQHASFTVPRYGHILEAVANCVHTLLKENTELQDEQRSILDEGRPQRLSLNFADESVAFSSSSLSLGQLALLSSSRWSQDGQMNDAPELHREVFVMHSELAHSREEVRQLSKQKELERDMQEAKLRKTKGEMSQMQLEMDEMQEMQQAHLEEVYVFQEELQKLRSRTPSDSNRSGFKRQEPCPRLPAEERISFPRAQWRWQSAQRESLPSKTQTTMAPNEEKQPQDERLEKNHGNQSGFNSQTQDKMDKARDRHSEYSFRKMDPMVNMLNAAQGDETTEFNESSEVKTELKHVEEDEAPTDAQLPTFGGQMLPRRDDHAAKPIQHDAAALKTAYSYAETLCDAQHYREALPLLKKIQDVGASKPQWLDAAGIRQADIWAYLGVAQQGESFTDESIHAYCEAIHLDPLLHVCHANLASLYSFKEDKARAQHHIQVALRLDPESQAYMELAKKLDSSTPS